MRKGRSQRHLLGNSVPGEQQILQFYGNIGVRRVVEECVVRNLVPKEKSGLCPGSWEITSKLLERRVFVIHGASIGHF